MAILKFDDFNYIVEDWDFDDDENEKKWEVVINGEGGSFWEYKYDAIESIVEILDTNGDENGLEGYIDDENDDDFEMSLSDITDMLTDMDEDEFYKKLDELKEYVGYDEDIRLINLADEDELEFLE